MKRFAVILAFSGLFLSAPAHSAEIVERILAVVNDEIVTEQDLQGMMAPITAQFRTMYAGKELSEKMKEARQEFLDKIIEDRLILSEARRKQVIVKDSEVDEMLAEVRNKFPTREAFVRTIEEQGMSEKKLWNRFRDQLMTQKLVSFEVKSRVSVSPGEVSEYYKAHSDEFSQGDRVRLQYILIRLESRTEEDALALATQIAGEVRAGGAFEDLARLYSEGAEAKDGGEMGWMERGQFKGDIDDKVFALEEGQITDPVKSALGYHVFKVTERQKDTVKPLDEVREDIQDLLFREKFRQRLDKWIQELKKDAYISVR